MLLKLIAPKDVVTYKHDNKGSDGRGEDQSCAIHGMLVVESMEEVVQGIRPCNSQIQPIHLLSHDPWKQLSDLVFTPSHSERADYLSIYQLIYYSHDCC